MLVRFFGFAVSAAYWPGILSAAYTPRWAVIAVGLPFVPGFRLGGPMLWLLGWLVVLGAMSLRLSPDQLTGFFELICIVLLCGTFIFGAALPSLDDLMIGLGVGLAISSCLTVMQALGWDGLPQSAAPAGLFYNREVLAEFAALVMVWAMLRPRWVIAFAAFVPVVLCYSRIAILTVLLGLLYAWCGRSKLRWTVSGCGLLILAAGSLFAMGFGKAASADHRLILWGATILAFEPFGHGLGWFQAAHPVEEFAHSDVLQAIVELGYGAVALVIIPIAAFWRKRGSVAERALFAAACFQMVVSFPLHMPAQGFLVAAVAGYLACGGAVVRLGQHLGTSDDVARA